MAAAGERTCFCDFLKAPARNSLGEPSEQPWTVWASAWGKKRGLRGGEIVLAREAQAQETEEFYFPYPDVMDPLGDGVSLSTDMVIRFDDGSPSGRLYDIDGIFPDEVHRNEVRVMAIRKRTAVS